MPEGEIIQRWVRSYGDQLYSYSLKRTGNADLAKDLVQDTFVAAFRSMDKYEERSSALAWLYAILKNKLIDHYRKVQRKPTQSLDDMEFQDDVFFREDGQWRDSAVKSWGEGSLDDVERKEFIEIFHRCRTGLPEKQNLAFIFKYLEGWNADDICKELEISSSNYWVLIHRAKLRLQKCLEENWLNQ